MNSQIRPAKKDDLPSLEQLYIQCMGDFEYTYYKTNFYAYITSNHNLIRVSEEPSGILSGFAIACVSDSRKARIQAIFVSVNYRKQGIGTDLLDSLEYEILAKYPDLRYFSIRIPEEFFTSQSFFLNRGFSTIAKINGYIKNNLDFPFSVNQEIKVRKAKKTDLKDILKIEKECFSNYWQMDIEKFKQIMKNPFQILYVALWNKKIIGYNFNAVSRTNHSGNYIRIATLPTQQRKRIATTLTAQAFKWFRSKQVDQVVLSTYADSSSHNEMYKKWGFRESEEETILARSY